jgi:hypothetical protein
MAIHIEQRARQAGKTTHCLNWLLADLKNRIVVTPNEQRAEEIRRMLAEATDTRPNAWDRHVVVCLHPGAQQGRKHKSAYIDQADHLLQALLGGHTLEGVTWDA